VYVFVLFFNVSFCFVFIVFVSCLIFRNYFPVEVYMVNLQLLNRVPSSAMKCLFTIIISVMVFNK